MCVLCACTFSDQEEYYKVSVHVSPAQKGYEVGSQITLNCTATPSPQAYDNFLFPVMYHWYSADRGYISSRSVIYPYEQDLTDYYCLVYRGGRLLGRERKTLNIKGEADPTTDMHAIYCLSINYRCS